MILNFQFYLLSKSFFYGSSWGLWFGYKKNILLEQNNIRDTDISKFSDSSVSVVPSRIWTRGVCIFFFLLFHKAKYLRYIKSFFKSFNLFSKKSKQPFYISFKHGSWLDSFSLDNSSFLVELLFKPLYVSSAFKFLTLKESYLEFEEIVESVESLNSSDIVLHDNYFLNTFNLEKKKFRSFYLLRKKLRQTRRLKRKYRRLTKRFIKIFKRRRWFIEIKKLKYFYLKKKYLFFKRFYKLPYLKFLYLLFFLKSFKNNNFFFNFYLKKYDFIIKATLFLDKFFFFNLFSFFYTSTFRLVSHNLKCYNLMIPCFTFRSTSLVPYDKNWNSSIFLSFNSSFFSLIFNFLV